MDIGGEDVFIECDQPSRRLQSIRDTIGRFWPDQFWEISSSTEFFIYENQEAKNSIDEEGVTDILENYILTVFVESDGIGFVFSARNSGLMRHIESVLHSDL